MDNDAAGEVLEESEELISRQYQTQLEEIAAIKNSIIHLPTGSGKTFIAIRLINRFRADLKKPWGQGGKRTFFLVNTVPLVNQQRKVIKNLCAVQDVGGFSSEDGVDIWDKSKWDAELRTYQVIVMTSQILADMLTHAYIKIEDINLLIFDECHHAVIDHPMRLVMKHFERCPVNKHPRVLGLTATLLNANVSINKVEETLRELETTFHATIATVDELGEVLKYSTNPHEVLKFYNSTNPTSAVTKAVGILTELQQYIMDVNLPKASGNPDVKLEKGQTDISSNPKKIVKEVKNMVVSMITFIEELGVYGGALAILAFIILMERLKRKASSVEEERMYKFAIAHSVTARAILLKSMEKESGYYKIVKHSSEKVLTLLNILKEYNPEMCNSPGVLMKVNMARKPLSGIIFTRQRFTAKVLYNLLKDVKEVNPQEFGFLNHDFVVGFNVNPFKCTREDYYLKKTSQKVMLKFCNKELNCLISTSVIEEGIDISQCRLVLRYDPPLEYRSYIQSKGRARSADSSYVIMVNAADENKFNKKYEAFKQTEKYIKEILIGNTYKRNAPTAREIQGLYDEDEIPPYVTSTGNRLSAVSAISLLNRYCSKLPHDKFTVITPMWIEEKYKYKRLIKIYMPIACPVKDVIEGIPQYQLKSAKRSAALNACIKLHKVGELDPITLLPRQYGTVNFDEADVKECFPNWPWDSQQNESEDMPKPGTKKRMRKHDKVFPSYLEGSSDWKSGSQTFYLHILKIKTAFKEPSDPREKALYNLLRRDEGFGLLTPKPLPKLCDFPMFLTVGEVKISLEMNYAVIQLDVQLFDLVKYFHFFIFDQVLEVAKKFVVFDGTMNCLYVVPIDGNNGDYDIDWGVMQTYRDIRPVGEPSAEERKNLQVTQETYQYHVVSPWYRGIILPARYIVSNILEYMTPQSLFDSKADPFNTFADYYSTKYNLDVVGNQNQPLLEVRNISTRMNCLLPRAATINAFSEKQQKLISLVEGDDKRNGFPEILVPEFCIKYDFPGVLWYKAILLPSVLHRLTMMLVAHELRAEIAKQTNYGQTHLLKHEDWLPIEVDMQMAIKSIRSQIEDPTPINTIDRINNPIDEEARRPIKIVSMKENIYQLQKKKIRKDYPWDENSEPIDIERNISTATVMDIECYDEFVSALMSPRTTIESIRSPPRQSTSAAILPPPIKYNDKISILSKKPSNRGPELRDVLAALTSIGSHDTFNLERMETLGDSFLKFAATLYLFHKFPGQNEGQLTSIKSRLIGNRNLYYAGEKVGLPGRMKIEQFGPRNDFMVPGFFAPKKIQQFIEAHNLRPTFLIGLQFSQDEALSGELNKDNWSMVQKRFADSEGTVEREPDGGAQNAMQCYIKSQAVSDKSVADCVEALIGTYLISGGISGAIKLLEWFKILPPQDNFAQLLNKKIPTVLSERKTSMAEIDRVLNDCTDDVESILNYKFKDPSLLLEALSHPSYIRNRFTPSYERLEFLGDAILDFLITAHIFEHCSSDLKPGELTDLRSALVNNVTFASYVVKLGLYKFLCYQFNPALDSAILTFVEHQERRNHEIVEDVLYLIAEEDCMLAEYIEVPKVLSDIFESLIGAIYLDSGGNLQAVWSVVYSIMKQEIYAFSRRIPLQPVRALHEMIHACPVFGTPRISNPDIPKVSVPVTITKNGRQHTVFGVGANKFQAKRAAAKLALKILGL